MRLTMQAIFLSLLAVTLFSQDAVGPVSDTLTGKQYVDARERVLAGYAIQLLGGDSVRELVARRSIAVRKAAPEVHKNLLAAERAAPGIYTGRLTAVQWWFGVVTHDIPSPDDRSYILAEAYLFRPFTEWDKTVWRRNVSQLVGTLVDARDLSDSQKASILLAIVAVQNDPQCTEGVIGALRTGYYHFQKGLGVIKEIVFIADAVCAPVIVRKLTEYGPRQRRDEWDDKYLKQSVDRGLEEIEAIASEAVSLHRSDVLILLADGLCANALALLDFGRYLDQPVDKRLIATISKAVEAFAADDALQKAAANMAEAMAAYPASKERAFLPGPTKVEKQP